MDFVLSKEHQLLRKMYRDFAETEVYHFYELHRKKLRIN